MESHHPHPDRCLQDTLLWLGPFPSSKPTVSSYLITIQPVLVPPIFVHGDVHLKEHHPFLTQPLAPRLANPITKDKAGPQGQVGSDIAKEIPGDEVSLTEIGISFRVGHHIFRPYHHIEAVGQFRDEVLGGDGLAMGDMRQEQTLEIHSGGTS